MTQFFSPLDSATEAALRASIERFGVLMPIIQDQHGNILDGNHRMRLAEQLGARYRVDVVVVESADEAEEVARTLNEDRRQIMPADLRRKVVAELREQGHSYRAIGGALGVHDTTALRDMQKTTAAGAAVEEPEHITGLDGKVRPARRETKPESPETKPTPITSKRNEVWYGKRYATMAIEQLRLIEPNDPNAIEALLSVKDWIDERIEEFGGIANEART